MTGAEYILQMFVISGFLVGAIQDHGNRGPGGIPFVHSGENRELVDFVALCSGRISSGTATVHLSLQAFHIDFEAAFHPVYDHTEGWSVGLAESGDGKGISKAVVTHFIPRS
ncbi:hypothetical protein SDC9_83075 [bioreactor metagenome]|uniref:Uncharacterized protein n=1 Tax=bioreactor metagenome TaxID=1076179 RepID=A0A644Z777_9ZZZZ